MTLRPLTNDGWGFESNCFVCEPRNPGGLRIPFFHDEASATVVANFNLDATFSGAPSYLHGGVLLAVLDEAMAWACIALAGRFAVTRTTTTEFRRPVRVGGEYKVVARTTAESPDSIAALAQIMNDRDRVYAEATADFAPLDAAAAREAVGVELTGDDTGFVAP